MKQHELSSQLLHGQRSSRSHLPILLLVLGFFTSCASSTVVLGINDASIKKNDARIEEEMFWQAPKKKHTATINDNAEHLSRLRKSKMRETRYKDKSTSNGTSLHDIMKSNLAEDMMDNGRSIHQVDHYSRMMSIKSYSYSYSYSYDDSNGSNVVHKNKRGVPPIHSKKARGQSAPPTQSPTGSLTQRTTESPTIGYKEEKTSSHDSGGSQDGSQYKENDTEQTHSRDQESKSFNDQVTTCPKVSKVIVNDETSTKSIVYDVVEYNYVIDFLDTDSTVESIVSKLSTIIRETVAQEVCDDVDQGRTRRLNGLMVEKGRSQRNLNLVALSGGRPAEIDDETCVPVDGARFCVVVWADLILELDGTSENDKIKNKVMTSIKTNMNNGKFVKNAGIQEQVTMRSLELEKESSLSPEIQSKNISTQSSTEEINVKEENGRVGVSNSVWFLVLIGANVITGVAVFFKLNKQGRDDIEVVEKLELPTPVVSLQDFETEKMYGDCPSTPKAGISRTHPQTPDTVVGSDCNHSSVCASMSSRIGAHPIFGIPEGSDEDKTFGSGETPSGKLITTLLGDSYVVADQASI
mmetsp:Transcript_35073/g.51511  ORF Transcript_35073/g.51511 Transcript_35073/m.51511 type:complete len:580 (-) Transcript_35073:250-1989(-)|eukprot:CAMPEP_0195521468 /NCGR_PEP_ID=MMETSP0794_2-20130614/18732_1 /TAXON_ID=515487 /ORGANISM="Stephanopyxis turris, Strain CCMP 815" /LENGTH=579 /DNA_ID=CAMNT_0040651033 /DNA_START=48 /DNA_END=1787 /DNA_ORIENTATION=+